MSLLCECGESTTINDYKAHILTLMHKKGLMRLAKIQYQPELYISC